MKKILFLLFLFATFAFADTSHHTDIFPRTVNFIIFAIILYYIISKPLKNMHNERIQRIAGYLQTVEDKLKDSKRRKDEAYRKLLTAEEAADGYIQTANKEIEIMKVRMRQHLDYDLAMLKKHFDDRKEFEKRKMTKEVVNDTLKGIFDENLVMFDQNELTEIMIKKVG